MAFLVGERLYLQARSRGIEPPAGTPAGPALTVGAPGSGQ